MDFVDRVVLVHEKLDGLDIPHAFGGALSLAYYSDPRGTVEIDLNVFVPPSDAAPIIERLVEIGVERPERALGSYVPTAGIRCPWDDTHIDLFLAYDDEFFVSVSRRVEIHAFEDSARRLHRLPFLSAEDLTIFKISFNRPKDWVDIGAMLEERQLDAGYVEQWLLHLRGDHEWPRIRRFLRMCERARPPDASDRAQ